MLPNATASTTAPLPGLGDGEQDADDSAQALVQLRWWTAPGAVATALAYYQAHVALPGPPVLSSADGSTRGLLIYRLEDTAYAQGIEVEINIAPDGEGVGVSIAARAAWVPQRPGRITIVDPTSVGITMVRMAEPRVQRVLGAGEAGRLAAIVNSMPVESSVGTVIDCPADYVDTTDTLVFATRAGPITVEADPTGCQFVVVTAGRTRTVLTGASPLLSTAGNDPGLNAELLTVLGLPPGYGSPYG